MSAPERTNWNTPVTVNLWNAVMAIRYGIGRQTYANSDASDLARRIWPLLDQTMRDQIRGDMARLTGPDAKAWAWLDDGMTAVVVENDDEENRPEGANPEGTALEGNRMTDAEFETFIRAGKSRE
jgi:hypothetical protein